MVLISEVISEHQFIGTLERRMNSNDLFVVFLLLTRKRAKAHVYRLAAGLTPTAFTIYDDLRRGRVLAWLFACF